MRRSSSSDSSFTNAPSAFALGSSRKRTTTAPVGSSSFPDASRNDGDAHATWGLRREHFAPGLLGVARRLAQTQRQPAPVRLELAERGQAGIRSGRLRALEGHDERVPGRLRLLDRHGQAWAFDSSRRACSRARWLAFLSRAIASQSVLLSEDM